MEKMHWVDLKYKNCGGHIFNNKRLVDSADYVAIDFDGEHLVLKDRYDSHYSITCGFKVAKTPIIISSYLIEGANEIYENFKRKLVNTEYLNVNINEYALSRTII